MTKYFTVRPRFLIHESDPDIYQISAPLSNIYNQGKTGNTVGDKKASFLVANGCRTVTGHAYIIMASFYWRVTGLQPEFCALVLLQVAPNFH